MKLLDKLKSDEFYQKALKLCDEKEAGVIDEYVTTLFIDFEESYQQIKEAMQMAAVEPGALVINEPVASGSNG